MDHSSSLNDSPIASYPSETKRPSLTYPSFETTTKSILSTRPRGKTTPPCPYRNCYFPLLPRIPDSGGDTWSGDASSVRSASSFGHDCSRHFRHLSRTSFSFQTPDGKFKNIQKATSPASIRTPTELHLRSQAKVLLVLTYTFHKASSRFDPRRVCTRATPNHPLQSFLCLLAPGMLHMVHCQASSCLFLKHKPEHRCTSLLEQNKSTGGTPLASASRTRCSKSNQAPLHRPCRTKVYLQSG